jgi:hypothetical protein
MTMKVKHKGFGSARRFGVELEVTDRISKPEIAKVIQTVDPERKCTHTEWAQSKGNNYWHVKRDRTCGHEVASFIAQGEADIRAIGNVAEGMTKRGVSVNNNCGLHIHAEISEYTIEDAGVLAAYWFKTEHVIAQMVPDHRRTNRHCRLMQTKHRINSEAKYSAREFYFKIEPTNLGVHENDEKRVALNYVNFGVGLREPGHNRNTVELRLPEGTLSRFEVENWTRWYVNYVDVQKGKSMPANLKSYNLEEALTCMGLHGEGEFFLLDRSLNETKRWVLMRLVSHANDDKLRAEALEFLNRMTSPLEVYKYRKVLAQPLQKVASYPI